MSRLDSLYERLDIVKAAGIEGPDMQVIETIQREGRIDVRCQWFDKESRLHREVFDERGLQLVQSASGTHDAIRDAMDKNKPLHD